MRSVVAVLLDVTNELIDRNLRKNLLVIAYFLYQTEVFYYYSLSSSSNRKMIKTYTIFNVYDRTT